MTPDPYKASAETSNPGNWNRYAYVGGDPINYVDPNGLARCGTTITQNGVIVEDTMQDCPSFSDLPGNMTQSGGLPFATRMTLPLLQNVGAGWQQQLFRTAILQADKLLKNQGCADMYGGESSDVTWRLNHATYHYLDTYQVNADFSFTKDGGSVWARTGYDATTGKSNNITTINDNGPFMAAPGVVIHDFDGYGVSLTTDQARVFALLHELGHLSGRGPEIDTSDDFNKLLLQECFGMKVKF